MTLSCLLALQLIFAPSSHALELLEYPEYTDEAKSVTSSQLLGIESDPENTLSARKSRSSNIVRSLESSVILFRNEGCGAVLISDSGHAVTALHCLESLKSGLVSPIETKTVFHVANGEEIRGSMAVQEMVGHEYNQWDFNAIRFPEQNELLPVKIVALGAGYPQIKKSWRPDDAIITENAEILKEVIDDYAIVKLNKIPKDHKCVKLAADPMSNGDIT